MNPTTITRLARHVASKRPDLSASEQAALVAKIVATGDVQIDGNGDLFVGAAGREQIASAKAAPKQAPGPRGRRYEPSGETIQLLKDRIARERPHLTEAERNALARQIAWSDESVTVDYSTGRAVLTLPPFATAMLGGPTTPTSLPPTAPAVDPRIAARESELSSLTHATSDRDKIRRAALLEERIRERTGFAQDLEGNVSFQEKPQS